MTPQQEELFDQAILRVLDRNESSFGMGATAIQVLVGEFGFTPKDADVVTRRLEYMADPQIEFVRPVDKGNFNAANRAWKITPKGINHLRERGL